MFSVMIEYWLFKQGLSLRKVWPLLLGCSVFVVFISARISVSEEPAPIIWQDSPDGYKYGSSGFSCVVDKAGVLTGIKAGKWLTVENLQIFTSFRLSETDKKRTRVFQRSFKARTIQFRKEGTKVFLRVFGALATGNQEPLADFEENFVFTADRITCNCKVTTTRALEVESWMPFCSLMTGKISSFIGCALHASDTRGQRGIYGIPKKYSRQKECWFQYLREAAFVRSTDEFTIALLPDSRAKISIQDGRSWNGNGIEIIVRPPSPRRRGRGKLELPAGSIFAWSFTLHYVQYK